jgi:hypothetical protein
LAAFIDYDPFLGNRYPPLVARRPGFAVVNRLPPQSTQRLGFPIALSYSPTTSTGILTCCPSPTPLGLGLGPTNPTWTDLPSETLDFRRTRFSRVSRYSCQHSHFRPLQRTLPVRLLRKRNAPLLLPKESLASVVCFSPVTLSAQSRLTSELLRTL